VSDKTQVPKLRLPPLISLQVPQAKKEIEEFVRTRLGYQVGGVRGKVLEFIKRNNPDHYRKLVDCGLIASKMGQTE
jgi:hypothetical protein